MSEIIRAIKICSHEWDSYINGSDLIEMHTTFHQVENTLTSPYEQVSMLLLNLLGLQNQSNNITKKPIQERLMTYKKLHT